MLKFLASPSGARSIQKWICEAIRVPTDPMFSCLLQADRAKVRSSGKNRSSTTAWQQNLVSHRGSSKAGDPGIS